MSWSVFVVPAHRLYGQDNAWIGLDLQSVDITAAPLPTVEQVLAVLVAAGCHGDASYRLDGIDNSLPRCVDYRQCDAEHGRDLGEVSLHCGGRNLATPVHGHDLVECVSMRKPRAGSLPAAIALASLGATQIAFDDGGGISVVIQPGQRVEDLAATWPWRRLPE